MLWVDHERETLRSTMAEYYTGQRQIVSSERMVCELDSERILLVEIR